MTCRYCGREITWGKSLAGEERWDHSDTGHPLCDFGYTGHRTPDLNGPRAAPDEPADA